LKTFRIYTDQNAEKVKELEVSVALLKSTLISLVHIYYYFPKYIDHIVIDGEDKEKKEPFKNNMMNIMPHAQ
jgi:hypothetical protein